ncbi:MAG TPA: hypothetical protein VFQ88_00265 [Nevskiaceae bacterium]|nr:hypothetical protein [Nevskiaceae bacterium]
MKTPKHYLVVLCTLLAALSLSACSTATDVQHTASFPAQARWALLPIVNDAQAPLAGQRAESIASALLRKRGVTGLTHYPLSDENLALPELNDARRLQRALKWARNQGFQYGLSGNVTEWGYKTGLDGEPAVGVTLKVIDITTGQVLWSASGARSGWGYNSLAGTAQVLLDKLIAHLPLRQSGSTRG